MVILEIKCPWLTLAAYPGQVVIHPSHVPIVNNVFTPSVSDIAYYKGLIETMKEAEKNGRATAVYYGDMVDHAMMQTAKEMIDFPKSLNLPV